MINRNEFQAAAKRFRGGRMSLSEFTAAVFAAPEQSSARIQPTENPCSIPFPRRAEDAHKGDCGRVLLIGGSATMPGAIALSAMAALRTGSGLATVLTTVDAQPTVAGFSPCLMTIGLSTESGVLSSAALGDILAHCHSADVIAIGPGMGRSASGQQIALAIYHEIKVPVVVDADALNNLADGQCAWQQHAGPRVLTPHPGEFARITGDATGLRTDMESRARELAGKNEITLLLKGRATFVTDGQREYHNSTGNSGMATAGSGDVLTGIIASLIGQHLAATEAAIIGCHLHGMAGDMMASRGATASLIATDLIDLLPPAVERLISPSAI